MKGWIFRLLGIIAILPALLFLVNSTRAQEPFPHNLPIDEKEVDVTNCRECHWPVYVVWESSTHGQALSCGQCHLGDQDNHAREGHWTQGGPQECMSCHTTGYDPVTDTWEEGNIHCTACHSPINENHPEEPMPTDRSAELCGMCHIEAHFEWRVSEHGQADVSCISCHSQHATQLKIENVTEQCATCHDILTDGYTHSSHFENGLSCADCHLATYEGPVTEGRAKRNHTFSVALATCTACHGEALHNAPSGGAAEIMHSPGNELAFADAMASNVKAEVSIEPPRANPLGLFALGSISTGVGIGGVGVGLAAVIFPRLSRLFGRIWRRSKNH